MKTGIEQHLTGNKLDSFKKYMKKLDSFKEYMKNFGGFFDIDLLAKKMKIEKKIILEMIRNKELIAFLDDNNTLLIPACQIHVFKLVEGLKELLNAFNEDKTNYDKIMFLTTYNESIQNTPIKELIKEMDRDTKKGTLLTLLNQIENQK